MEKYITVPKDREAMMALDYNLASSEQLFEIVLHEDQFNLLWSSGIFQSINEIASVNIDYSEDESITDLSLLKKILSSDFLYRDYSNEELTGLVSQLKNLILKAIDCETGIFFYF